MSTTKKINTALISVFDKAGIEPIVRKLHELGVEILSTGGTRTFIEGLGVPCRAVEKLTGYPSILGGRVKTLHPKVFGGILARRENAKDLAELAEYEIPQIDLVIVDLYPFVKTVRSGASEADIIEKIDIGGVSLIRAAAKNFADTLIVASSDRFAYLMDILERRGAESVLDERRSLAASAFATTSAYDTAIARWFAGKEIESDTSLAPETSLRYGENPHQKAEFVPGDTIITSGYSAVFPSGLPVGEVLDDDDDHSGNFFTLKIRLFADFTTLGNVQVLRNNSSDELRNIAADENKDKVKRKQTGMR